MLLGNFVEFRPGLVRRVPLGSWGVAAGPLGGSAVNWAAIAPLLTGRYRMLAVDLAGHGFTRSMGRGTDIVSSRVLLHRSIEAVPGGPVILMGNSMGGMISLLQAIAAPRTVSRTAADVTRRQPRSRRPPGKRPGPRTGRQRERRHNGKPPPAGTRLSRASLPGR